MSYRIMNWVLHEAPLPNRAAALAVAIALADFANEDEDCQAWPSIETLAKLARCSARTTQRALSDLEGAGVIEVGDQGLVAEYRADRRPTVWRFIGYINMRELSTAGRQDDTPNAHGVSICHERGVNLSRTGCQNDTQTSYINQLTKPSLCVTKPVYYGHPVDNFDDTHTIEKFGLEKQPPAVATRLADIITEQLNNGTSESIITAALNEWHRRAPAAPGLLPYLISDQLTKRNEIDPWTTQPPQTTIYTTANS